MYDTYSITERLKNHTFLPPIFLFFRSDDGERLKMAPDFFDPPVFLERGKKPCKIKGFMCEGATAPDGRSRVFCVEYPPRVHFR